MFDKNVNMKNQIGYTVTTYILIRSIDIFDSLPNFVNKIMSQRKNCFVRSIFEIYS